MDRPLEPLDVGAAALVPGRAAHRLARMLAREARAAVDAGRRLSESDLQLIRVLRAVGDRWATTSESGSAEVVDPGDVPPWTHDRDTCTATEAADLLGVGDRRVRQLCDAGTLDAVRTRSGWLIDRTSILAYRQR